jgi:hypothetical protein
MKFHFHDWSKWSDPVRASVHGVFGYRKQQWKICKVCNKVKFRTLWWDGESNLGDVLEALRKVKEQ